jgi:hypothetical protein
MEGGSGEGREVAAGGGVRGAVVGEDERRDSTEVAEKRPIRGERRREREGARTYGWPDGNGQKTPDFSLRSIGFDNFFGSAVRQE